MITIRKLNTLEERTRVRKCIRLLQEAVLRLQRGEEVDIRYYGEVCRILERAKDERVTKGARDACIRVSAIMESQEPQQLLWSLSDAVHLLLSDLQIERADWDFVEVESGKLDGTKRVVFPFTVVLDRIRSPFNTGSIFRTADSFGVSSILLVDPSASPDHPRAQRSARGCTETVPWSMLPASDIQSKLKGQPVFALELGGRSCSDFQFPRQGVVIIGSEELGVSPEMLSLAEASLGRVSIPLSGSKGSLNVSVAFGILMHQWFSRVAEQDT